MPESALRQPRPFGKFFLLRQLAVGGMAEVYLAKQSGPAGFEKECVIKRILPSLALDQQFVEMFLDEARIAARLTHPNIVQIFDFGEATGPGAAHDYFIAMEHVHGVDLQNLIETERARSGRMPLAIALRIVSNVAEGLDHAHHATDGRGQPLGIVHRDVTPSNVMVSYDGVAKICDFGIAKASMKGGRTEVGVIKGKMPYMSPEQVGGEPLDARSDLFSLGTLLYELTDGAKPFDGSSPGEISIKVLHDQPPLPELVVEHYPDVLSAIVMKLLSKKPEQRFGSAREVQVALEEFLVAGGIRCGSAEVAGYLDALLPGQRDRVHADMAAPLPSDATDPTVPMHLSKDGVPTIGATEPGGGPDDNSPGPIMRGDLSTSQMQAFDDVRRNLGGGGGGGMKYVVVLLVLAVAFGFWWLKGHTKPEEPPPASPSTISPAAVATPPTPTPTPTPLAATPAPTAKAAPTELPAPAVAPVAAPESVVAKPAVAAKPATAVKPKPKPHKPTPHKAAPKAAPAGDRPLPHLPSPPPADDGT